MEESYAWEIFGEKMKQWEAEFGIKLFPPDIEFKIVEDKSLIKPFRKGDLVFARYRFPESVEAQERLIHIPSLKDYPSKDVGICLDVGHANMYENPYDAIKICGERLIHTHLSDNDGKADLHLWLGKGSIDWRRIAKSASEINYKGLLMLEIRKDEMVREFKTEKVETILGINFDKKDNV